MPTRKDNPFVVWIDVLVEGTQQSDDLIIFDAFSTGEWDQEVFYETTQEAERSRQRLFRTASHLFSVEAESALVVNPQTGSSNKARGPDRTRSKIEFGLQAGFRAIGRTELLASSSIPLASTQNDTSAADKQLKDRIVRNFERQRITDTMLNSFQEMAATQVLVFDLRSGCVTAFGISDSCKLDR